MAFLDSNFNKWVISIAAFVAIVIPIRDFTELGRANHELITRWTITSLLFLLFFGTIIREYLTSRKEKYANINHHKHRCIHLTRDLTTYLQENIATADPETVKKMVGMALQQIMNELAELYTLLTGTKCRATLKTVYSRNGKLYVYAMARDGKSADTNKKKDKERQSGNLDPIEENVDFSYLYDDFGPNSRCFFCNDLTTKRNYRTSSFKVYGNPPENVSIHDRWSQFVRHEKDWPLPYRSTIVWPVQQRESRLLPLRDTLGCIGFLAIDSESRNVFREKWDFPIGATISDALFHPLKLYASLEKNDQGGA